MGEPAGSPRRSLLAGLLGLVVGGGVALVVLEVAPASVTTKAPDPDPPSGSSPQPATGPAPAGQDAGRVVANTAEPDDDPRARARAAVERMTPLAVKVAPLAWTDAGPPRPRRVHMGTEVKASVQEAIDAASPGETVILDSGLYEGGIVVRNKRGLKLVAPAGLAFFLEPDPDKAVLVVEGSSNVFISGLGFEHSAELQSCSAATVVVERSTQVELESLYVAGSGYDGIRLRDAADVVLTNVLIEECSNVGLVVEKVRGLVDVRGLAVQGTTTALEVRDAEVRLLASALSGSISGTSVASAAATVLTHLSSNPGSRKVTALGEAVFATQADPAERRTVVERALRRGALVRNDALIAPSVLELGGAHWRWAPTPLQRAQMRGQPTPSPVVNRFQPGAIHPLCGEQGALWLRAWPRAKAEPTTDVLPRCPDAYGIGQDDQPHEGWAWCRVAAVEEGWLKIEDCRYEADRGSPKLTAAVGWAPVAELGAPDHVVVGPHRVLSPLLRTRVVQSAGGELTLAGYTDLCADAVCGETDKRAPPRPTRVRVRVLAGVEVSPELDELEVVAVEPGCCT